MIPNKSEFFITTNGQNAEDIWQNNPARDGNGVDQNRKGMKGFDGSDGKSGKSAGHIYVVANELPSIKASQLVGEKEETDRMEEMEEMV